MHAYLDILFEPIQSKKLEILKYFSTLPEGNYQITNLLGIAGIKKDSTIKSLLEEIEADLESCDFLPDTCQIDRERKAVKNFGISEYEQMRRFYFEHSAYFKLFDSLLTERYLSAEVIAHECDLTRSQYYNATKSLNERLMPYGIEILSRKLVGQEYLIRFMASHLYAHFLPPDSPWFHGQYQYSSQHMAGFLDGLLETTSVIGRHWLVCCHFVTKQRIDNNHFVTSRDNQLIQSDVFDGPDAEFVNELYARFQYQASNQNVIKLNRERTQNEIIYFLHVIPLSGFQLLYPTSRLIAPQVKRRLVKVEEAVVTSCSKHMQLEMTHESWMHLFEDVKLLLYTVIAFGNIVVYDDVKRVEETINHFYPVGTAIGRELFESVLIALEIERIDFWLAELGPDFVNLVIPHLDYQAFMPEVKIALDFSHSLNLTALTKQAFETLPEVKLSFVGPGDPADVLMTDVARRQSCEDYALYFCYSSVPTPREWSDMKERIKAHSVKLYQQQSEVS
jgi:hypothetical protein